MQHGGFEMPPEVQNSPVFLIVLISCAIFVILFLALMVVGTICCWKIFKKAGYSGALGLLFLLSLIIWPVGELVVLFMLAFGKWPVLQELNRLKESQGQSPQ
jgi:heme/copper-type cytochrome/quinol oxidase subunit 2